jgi:hypothetical protein
MFFKKVYHNPALTIQNFTEKSLLCKKIYNKFFIRSSLAKVKTIKVLDNGSNFFHISSKSKPTVFFKKATAKKNLVPGRSFYGKNEIYTNQLNKHLKFKYFSAQETNLTFNNFQTLLQNKSTTFSSVIVLNPLKGGYRIYNSGVIGFIPNRHIIKNSSKINKMLISKQITLASNSIVTSQKRFKTLKKSVITKTSFFLKNLFLNTKFVE